MKHPAFNVFSADCPSRAAFEAIFSRWGILVLGFLGTEPTRFGALCRGIDGISEKMLTQTLKVLEEQGLVHRTEWNEKPPRVEYSLTTAGVKVSRGITEVLEHLYEALDLTLT